jgi:hypothetical protein
LEKGLPPNPRVCPASTKALNNISRAVQISSDKFRKVQKSYIEMA